jgi:4-hydroxyphenylpyruvate dioxygenase-like putative hemolysin
VTIVEGWPDEVDPTAVSDAPRRPGGDRHAQANAPGIRHLGFAVDDINAVVARLRARGAELVGELER